MSAPAGPQTEDWIDTARLLRRTGFGATGAAVDAAVQYGRAGYLARALAGDPDADPGARVTPLPAFPPRPKVRRSADAAARKAANKATRAQLRELAGWWVRRMVSVQQPLPEKLTFCWHNHFATSAAKVRDASFMAAQNQKLRAMGRGSFHELALAMLTDAAMLKWLDGQKNVAGAANENLGREFMELFTLGHGDGYTETDVREGSRALTGWVIKPDGSTALVGKRHDTGSKTFLGVTGDLDHVDYCAAVLNRPASAGYLATRTWRQLSSNTPPTSAAAARMAGVFRPQWDISALLATMLLSDEFVAGRNTMVVNPVEWLVGALRALGVPVSDPRTTGRFLSVLNSLGQLPFYPPSVGGWAAGPAWLSTAAADIRMRTALSVVGSADLDAVASAAPANRVDAAGYLLGIGRWSTRSRAVLADATSDPRRLVALALNTSEYLTN